MNRTKYITVSEAIGQAKKRVVYPALTAMFLIMAGAISILAVFGEKPIYIILSITLMIVSFVVFGVIMTYLGGKWKIWAYTHVDDVREFRKRTEDNRLSVNIYPSKWHLSVKKDRLVAFSVIRERVKNYTLSVSLEEDYSILRKLEIKRSFFYYAIPLSFCIWACSKTTDRLIHGTSTEFIIDIIFSLSSSVGIFFLLIKLVKYPTLISISESGIWTKKTGLQPWSMVESFGFSAKSASNPTTGMHITNHLHIKIKSESGLEEKKRFVNYDATELNKKSATIEKTIKVYHNRYMKKQQ